MADEELQAEVSPEEKQEAVSMGWADKDQWRGAEEDWVDAKTFLERGRTVMPMLRKNNERLLSQVGTLTSQVGELMEQLKATNASMRTLEESNAEDVKLQVEEARKALRAEMTRASREGDHEGLAEATEKLVDLNTAAGKVEKTEKTERTEEDPKERKQVAPEVLAWYTANPEFRTNPRKVALHQAVAYEMRQDPANNTLIGAAFLDAVAAEVEKTLGESPRQRSSKVSGGNGGRNNGGGSGGGGGKTYADLPAAAKEACDRQAARLVGPNRAHKTEASWRSSYAKQYFSE